MDIFDLLKKDHDKVKELFQKLDQTGDRAQKTRETLFTTLREEFELHAEAEEKYFYPRLESESETESNVEEAYAEHKQAKKMLRELGSMDKTSEDWVDKLTAFREAVEHHVEEEEDELFPKARKVLEPGEAETLAAEVEEYKQDQKAGAKRR